MNTTDAGNTTPTKKFGAFTHNLVVACIATCLATALIAIVVLGKPSKPQHPLPDSPKLSAVPLAFDSRDDKISWKEGPGASSAYVLRAVVASPTQMTWTLHLKDPLSAAIKPRLEPVENRSTGVEITGDLVRTSQLDELKLTLSGAVAAGDYTSSITFPGAANSKGQAWPIALSIRGPRKITPPATIPTRTVCVGTADWLFDPIAGVPSHSETFQVSVHNAASSAETPSSLATIINDSTGAFLNSQSSIWTGGPLNPGNSPIAVDLSKVDLAPGQYTAYAEMTFDKPTETVDVPFTLDVRDSPWLALGLMAIGMLAGYLARESNSTQSNLREQLFSLRSSLTDISPRPKALFEKQMETLQYRIDHTPADPALTSDINSLQTCINAARTVRNLDERFKEAYGAPPAGWHIAVMSALTAAESLDSMSCTVDIGNLETYISNPNFIPVPAAPAAKIGAEPGLALAHQQPLTADPTVRTMMISHTGTKRASERRMAHRSIDELKQAHFTLTLIRAGISVAAIGILGLTAMKTLYGAGFGHAMTDYLAVLAWGFGSGVAGKGLSTNLTPTAFGG